jgi:MEMO1 family protein
LNVASVRPPAVAGQFYPADPARLRAEVEDHLSAAAVSTARRPPKAVIAPHAGYVYSGRVAGHAFAAVPQSADIQRIVAIGPAHWVPLHGIAAPTHEAFETPLGRVPVDREALAGLADLPAVRFADEPHALEHALEVELPFLQVRLGDCLLVPLLVGDARPQDVAAVLDRLWGGPETLIVVSSDLSHHLDYRSALQRDAATATAIEAGAWAKLGPYDACGWLPVVGLLLAAERHGLSAERLALMNSGDAAGPRDSVVGYGAWAFVVRDHIMRGRSSAVSL